MNWLFLVLYNRDYIAPLYLYLPNPRLCDRQQNKQQKTNMAGKSLAHRGTGGTSLTSEDDAVPDIDTNNVCEGASLSPVLNFF